MIIGFLKGKQRDKIFRVWERFTPCLCCTIFWCLVSFLAEFVWVLESSNSRENSGENHINFGFKIKRRRKEKVDFSPCFCLKIYWILELPLGRFCLLFWGCFGRENSERKQGEAGRNFESERKGEWELKEGFYTRFFFPFLFLVWLKILRGKRESFCAVLRLGFSLLFPFKWPKLPISF